jgi:hypothetical protein
MAGDHPHERARLLITIALERRADEGTRGIEAAAEAEALARELDDPYLLALALNGRFLQTFSRAGLAGERAAIGRQLLDIAAAQPPDRGLPAVAVLGHLILVQAGAAQADLACADDHAAVADELAERHGIPLVGVFTAWYAALRMAMVGGEVEEIRDAYQAAAARLPGSGMPGVENGLLPLALLCLDLARGGDGKSCRGENFGPYQPWADALFGVGPAVAGSPHDLLFEARTGLQALVALREGDQAAMRRAYAQLLPAEDELAGAGSGMVTLGPVAGYLGRLAQALGEAGRAAEHFAKADQIGRRTAPRS